jgi:hypothetical protein
MSTGPRTEPDPDDDYLHFDLPIDYRHDPGTSHPALDPSEVRLYGEAAVRRAPAGTFMHQPIIETDVIGGFPVIDPNCAGCGQPLTIDNAWMSDGCGCNSPLGVNSMNETRWRLLMQLQQRQTHEIAELRERIARYLDTGGIMAASNHVILELPL